MQSINNKNVNEYIIMIIEIISVKYIDFISQSFSLLIETDGPDDDLSDLNNNNTVRVTASVEAVSTE